MFFAIVASSARRLRLRGFGKPYERRRATPAEISKQAVAAGFGLGFLSAHAVQQELALGRLAVIAVKGFPVMRQWYVVHRRDRRLPPITEAFQRFMVKEGARLIRSHERAMA